MLNGGHRGLLADWRSKLALGRIRGTWSGLDYALVIVLIVSSSMGFHEYTNRLPFDSLWAIAFGTAWATAVYLGIFLIPLPVYLLVVNRAPVLGLSRYLWLVPTSLLYGFACGALTVRGLTANPHPPSYVFVVAVALTIIFEFHRRASRGAAALLGAQIDVVRLQSELQRASLHQLQAQIEPHFLFNTLATIRRLSQVDRSAATKMIADLTRYFTVALPRLKGDEATLGSEAELAAAYLDIHRVRMGSRVAYEISIPQDLASVRVPPMMLLTLVENAIKHGIAPLVEGGFIAISAKQSKGMVDVQVADSGQGMTAQQGHGMGLANARARLALLYGGTATISLAHAQPRGVIATLTLPARWAA